MIDNLTLFFLVSLVATATPGPSIVYVTTQGVAHGLRPAAAAGSGVLAADALYILLSITGLTAILIASHEVFTLIKWAGVAYLVYLGLRLLAAGFSAQPDPAAAPRAIASPRRSFLGGFALHAANPKALLYFGSLVPQFIDPSRPIAAQLVFLAAIHLATAGCVLGAYSVFAGRFHGSSINARVRRAFNIATGGFFVSAGISLALMRR